MFDSISQNQGNSNTNSVETALPATTGSRRQLYTSLSIALLILVINCLRIPELLFTPRFWAEEGTTYFSSAYSSSFFTNMISAHYGYFTLYNNIVTSLATFAPLETAPLVTIYAALAVQIAVSLLIIYSNNPLLSRPYQRYAVALLVPLVSYAEVWLTTIGVQYWLGIAAFFILINNRSTAKAVLVLEGITLMLAGLTGVIACLLTPAYLLKAYWEKTRAMIVYSAILILCCFVQIAVFLQAFLAGSSEVSDRFTGNSVLIVFIKWVSFQCSIPFFGRGVFEYEPLVKIGTSLNKIMISMFGKSIFPSEIIILPFLVGLLVLIFLAILTVINRQDIVIRITALSFLIVAFFSTILSLKMSGGPRYTFAPSVMLLVILIGSIKLADKRKIVKSVCAFIVFMAITMNTYEFWPSTYIAYNQKYPDWRTQVLLWRALGPEYQLKIWPPPWTMSLQNNNSRTD